MNRMPLALAIPAGLALLLGLTLMNRAQPQPAPADNAPTGLEVGQDAVVYLRGDVSGMAFSDRGPSEGFLISRSGKVASVDAKWLVLDGTEKRHAIPVDAVAVIDASPKK